MLEKDLKKVIDGVYPFHMPGHKRQKEWLEGLYDLDITEISGADDLHAPSGVIYEAQRRVSRQLGTVSTIFLTGGSTCGILAAISAICDRGDNILIARNCHRSVYNACLTGGLDPEFVYPVLKPRLGCFGEIRAADVAEALEKRPAKAVVITSPTYEGILSDVSGIAKVVHKNKALLIVDSAHGAHLGLSDYFPKSARSQGADIVIESAHKTMPCLTGAALLHVCSHRVSYSRLQEALGIYETSSPPYPILCSIDRGYKAAADPELFRAYAKRLDCFYEKTKTLSHLSLFESGDFDRGKLVIFCGNSNISGFELKKRLREKYAIETEMAFPFYTLAMTSAADTDEGFERLFAALKSIDSGLSHRENGALLMPPKAKRAVAMDESRETVILPGSAWQDNISAEFVYAYPPGSPIIAPGEVFSRDIGDYISYLSAAGAQIYSSKGNYPEKLAFFAEKD